MHTSSRDGAGASYGGLGLEALCATLSAEGYGDRIRRDESVASHTSFEIGGPADLLLVAEELPELVRWLGLARSHGVPCLVIGGGTNILVADAGVRGAVIVNSCQSWCVSQEGLLIAESGAKLADLAQRSILQGWGGLEWAVGVPGTLGGAIVGNAGAYGGCMADSVRWVRWLLPDGRLDQVSVEALEYGYRTSVLKRETRREQRPVVLEAALQLRSEDVAELQRRAADITNMRNEKTPRGRSAGSIFKRTMQYPAGFLIEQAGLKGVSVGGATVSRKHANFVLNTGTASASDVKRLIERIQRQVWEAFGQRLEPEIELVGDWPDLAGVAEGLADTTMERPS
ncbi:MAG: UDP-N-acetylmuramate dehydrogenase [Anaerolineae bacterium]|nr:UDP-N-acetylmuramate dehydrogenase [Anaerolineae bacterium]